MRRKILVDAGPIIAFFNKEDDWHEAVFKFYEESTDQFITTYPVVTEALWKLKHDRLVQNELYLDLEKGIYQLEILTSRDFKRIGELNIKYGDQKPDFADLSLIAISERLNISNILTVDKKDFDIYKRLQNKRFIQIPLTK